MTRAESQDAVANGIKEAPGRLVTFGGFWATAFLGYCFSGGRSSVSAL